MSLVPDLISALDYRLNRRKERLEVEKPEAESSLVRKADLHDVEKYDPKIRRIKELVEFVGGRPNLVVAIIAVILILLNQWAAHLSEFIDRILKWLKLF